jgi:hypothetical protein
MANPSYAAYSQHYHNPHLNLPLDEDFNTFNIVPNPYMPVWMQNILPQFGIDIYYECGGAIVYYLPAVTCHSDISQCVCGATPTGRFMNDFNNSCCASNVGRDFYGTWYDAAADCPTYIKYNLKESLGQVCVGLYWQGVAL